MIKMLETNDSNKVSQLKSLLGADRVKQLYLSDKELGVLYDGLLNSIGKPYTATGEYLKANTPSGASNDFKAIASGSAVNTLNSEFTKSLSDKTQGIDLSRISDAMSIFGITPEEAAVRTAVDINPAVNNEFKSVLGREATATEISAILNKMDLKGYFGEITQGGASIPDLTRSLFGTSESLQKAIKNANVAGFIKQSKPMFDQITLAQNNLKNIGKELGADEITNILNSTPEQAKELSASYVKSYQEGATKGALADLPAKQKAVLDELDQALRGSQEKFFSQELQPSIERSLASRGLLRSGSLAEALASQAGKLNTAREGVLSPLRSSTALGTQQLGFENTLRGALEGGKTLSEATGFINDLFKQDKQNVFTAGQADLNRAFTSEQTAQNQALMQALLGGQADGPSAWDYFYQYGLPVLGTALAGPLGGAAAGGLSKLFSKSGSSGGGGYQTSGGTGAAV